mmetsp:Transcript_8213/g.17692  ORF Transcript_8213/g.17692 Transcript_8213/m.17692 type:complete len:236 (+) Transcript_8213:832-1539(+)
MHKIFCSFSTSPPPPPPPCVSCCCSCCCFVGMLPAVFLRARTLLDINGAKSSSARGNSTSSSIFCDACFASCSKRFKCTHRIGGSDLRLSCLCAACLLAQTSHINLEPSPSASGNVNRSKHSSNEAHASCSSSPSSPPPSPPRFAPCSVVTPSAAVALATSLAAGDDGDGDDDSTAAALAAMALMFIRCKEVSGSMSRDTSRNRSTVAERFPHVLQITSDCSAPENNPCTKLLLL